MLFHQKLTLLKTILLPVILLMFFVSCSEQNVSQSLDKQTEAVEEDKEQEDVNDRNPYVSKELAKVVAEQFANGYNFRMENLVSGNQAKRKSSDKEVEHILTLKDPNGEEALYLVNYIEKGFVVIPADKRIEPILAFSDTNKMPVTKDAPIPAGLDLWINSYVKTVYQIRQSKQKGGKSSTNLWGRLIGGKSLQREPIDPGCEEWTERVDPLLETTWGQQGGFNDSMPQLENLLSCDAGDLPDDGRAYVGCTNVALGQIMRYHEYPSNYQWGNMDNNEGDSENADFLRDVANEADITYGCEATSGDPDTYVPTLVNDFGYSSSTEKVDLYGESSAPVRASLDAGNPVIMRGNGHAWVGDGYIYSGLCPSGNYRLKYHLNWGWDGRQNGWYGVSDFTPYDKNYYPNSEVIINIKP